MGGKFLLIHQHKKLGAENGNSCKNRFNNLSYKSMNDQNPGLEDPSEGGETLELEPEITSKEPSGDPLDEIDDVELALAEAKKYRAIARRLEKKEETPVPTPEVKTDTSQFVTKTDFYKSNERKAIREIIADAEIKAVWNEIIPFYTPRRGKETPEDIKEDILDAITLYKARNPDALATDDSVDQLMTTPVVKTGGGTVDKTTVKPKAPPNFKLPTSPDSWYKKPS